MLPSNPNMRIKVLLVLLASGLTSWCEQVLPDSLRSLPVHISLPLTNGNYGIGTGIYLLDSNKVFLITAKHVFYDFTKLGMPLISSSANFYALPKDKEEKGRDILNVDLRVAEELHILRKHRTRDIAVLYIGSVYTNQTNFSIWMDHQWVTKPPESLTNTSVSATRQSCLLSTNAFDAAEVLMMGYPVELLKSSREVDFDAPLVRRGIISQINSGTGKFIIDSGVYGGNSGGPLLVIEHPALGTTFFRVAGIITQFVPAETRVFPDFGYTNSVLVFSGYSVAEPIDGALELMEEILKEVKIP